MIRHEAIEKRRFDPRQSKARIGIWGGPIEHRHPEHAPAQNAKHGDQLDQAFRGSEPRFLSSATGFQHLVERLNLPPQGIPAKLFDGGFTRGDRQISDQLPVDLRPIGWLIALLNIEYRQGQRRISLLFSNRRQDPDAAVPQFDNSRLEPAFAVANFDRMLSGDGGLRHLVGDRMAAVSGQPVDASPDQKVRAQLRCRTEQLVDVALSISDMDAARGVAEERCGFPASECSPCPRSEPVSG